MIEWESGLATDQQRSVVATFDTLLDRLKRDFPETYDVLRVLSFLDPEDMPLAMLTDGAQTATSPLDQPLPGNPKHKSSIITRIAKWTHIQRPSQNSTSGPSNPSDPLPELRSIASLILSPTAFPKAQQKLQSLSLVEPLSRDGRSSLRMHDLVHFLTREHVKRQPAYQAWLKSTVSLICGTLQRVEDPDLPEWWPECERLMPHVRSLSKAWTGVEGVNLELLNADVRLAQYLNCRGRYDDAKRLCEHSVEIFRKELGEKHENTLAAFFHLARIYSDQERFTDAEGVLKHVLAVRKKTLGADHHDTLYTMNDLAEVYRQQGRYKEAEELFKRILSVEKKKSDPDPIHTLQAVNNLALIYDSQNRFDEAEALFKRALIGCEKQLGPSHPGTLTTLSNLALLYQSQARNDEAEHFFLRAFTGRKQHLGADHPDTLDCAKHFAAFYRSQGRNSEADALLEG
jgi:tetratricopeptide (TPR) repeat protein